MAQVIKIGMDVTDVKTATTELINALQGQEAAVNGVFRKMAETNKEGNVTRATFAGITDEGNKVEATLKKVAAGWELVSSKVILASDALKKIKEQQDQTAGKNRANAGEAALLGAFDTKGLSLGQANAAETAIQRIKNILAEGGVEVARFQKLLSDFQNNRGIMPGLSQEEQQIVKSFRTIQNAVEQSAKAKSRAADESAQAAQKSIDVSSKQAQKAIEAANLQAAAEAKARLGRANANAGEQFIRSQIDFSKIDPSKLAQVESALSRVKNLLESGKISLQRFQEILSQLKVNPNQIIPNLTPAEQQASQSIRTLMDGAEKTKTIFISLGGILRLLEAQVLKRIFSVLENEILQSISAAKRFSIQIAEIRTISQEAQLTTAQWGNGITALSSKFGKTQTDVAEAAYQTLSNQVAKGGESFKFLESALGFSQAAVASATDSVNLLSGALKSFQLPMQDAERVGAILFKTIELGRVRANEMADTFGRVGTISKDAGVKLEEVSAAIAVLTNRGIKFNDASTLVQNILLKLIRPTEEMKLLFKEWGVASGTAAIATFGFSGVLQKLDIEAAKGSTRIGDLLGQIRAIRGVIGLTGGAFDDFEKYLKKITSAQEEYKNAQLEVANAPGQRAQKQLTELRNFFERDFGAPFLSGLTRITEGLGGATSVIKTANFSAQALLATYVAYRAVLLTSHAALQKEIVLTELLSASKTKLTFSIAGATTALRGFGTAALAAAPPVAAFAALFTSGFLLGEKLFGDNGVKSIEQLRSAANAFTDEQIAKRKNITDAETKESDKTFEETRDNFQKRYQTILQFSANVMKLSTDVKDRAAANMKAVSEQLKGSSTTYFDILRKNMAAFTDAVHESDQLIKSSRKEVEDLPRRGTNRIFDEKFKYASEGNQDPISGMILGDQKIEMLKTRIIQLAAQARAEFGKGTKESIEEGRKLFNDVERLQGQIFEAETAKDKKVFDFQAKSGQLTTGLIGPDGRPRYEFIVRTAELERQINTTTRERLALETQVQEQQEKRKKDAEEAHTRENTRIKALQQQFMLLEKINLYDKEGKLKKDYTGPGGNAKILGEFDERRAKILELAGQDPTQGYQVFMDLAKQRSTLIQEVRAAMNQEAASKIQEGAGRDIQAVERLTTQAREKIEAFKTESEKLIGGLNQQIGVYTDKLLTKIPGGTFTAEAKRQEALEKLNTLNGARDAFNAEGGRTTENAIKIQQAIEALNTSLREYLKLRGMPDPSNLAINGDKSGMTVATQLGATSSIGDRLVKGAQDVKEIEKQRNATSAEVEKLNDKLLRIPGAVEAMRESIEKAAPSTQANFRTLAISASDYASQLERINAALNLQKAEIPEIPKTDIEAEGKMFGGTPKYMNSGGMVGFVPRGSDRIPAMLAKDEMVMTEAATRQFMPLLKAMNSGTAPKYFNQGGPVTNVGDISINVSGGKTDEETIRNIGQGLRRGIRRGTIKLD